MERIQFREHKLLKYLHRKTNTIWKVIEEGERWCDCINARWVRITDFYGNNSKLIYLPTFEREYVAVP